MGGAGCRGGAQARNWICPTRGTTGEGPHVGDRGSDKKMPGLKVQTTVVQQVVRFGTERKALELKLASVLSQEPHLPTSDVCREVCKWLKLRINHFQEL